MASLQAEHARRMMFVNPKPDNQSVTDERSNWEAEARALHMLPDGVRVKPVLAGVDALWVDAPQCDNGKVILHLHGGGYIAGSPFIYRRFASYTALASSMPVLLPEYALAPEHPYPAAANDAMSTYRWLLKQGYSGEEIALIGDSAGGGLAITLLMMLREKRQPMPGAVVLISPWTDLTVSSPSYLSNAALDPVINPALLRAAGELYAGTTAPDHPMISPLFADLAGLAPMLIQVGEHERMLDDSVLFAQRAGLAGVDVTLQIWPQMWHVFQQHCPDVPEAWEAILALADYIKLRMT